MSDDPGPLATLRHTAGTGHSDKALASLAYRGGSWTRGLSVDRVCRKRRGVPPVRDGGLAGGRQYDYGVSARSGVGTSAWSGADGAPGCTLHAVRARTRHVVLRRRVRSDQYRPSTPTDFANSDSLGYPCGGRGGILASTSGIAHRICGVARYQNPARSGHSDLPGTPAGYLTFSGKRGTQTCSKSPRVA